MTQDIYEVITRDLLEFRILRSIHEPLPLSDLIAETLIVPLGVHLHKELEEVGIHWTPNYLPYYIDSVYTTTTSTTAKNLYLYRTSEQEDPGENWNTQYPQRQSPYSFDILYVDKINRYNNENKHSHFTVMITPIYLHTPTSTNPNN